MLFLQLGDHARGCAFSSGFFFSFSWCLISKWYPSNFGGPCPPALPSTPEVFCSEAACAAALASPIVSFPREKQTPASSQAGILGSKRVLSWRAAHASVGGCALPLPSWRAGRTRLACPCRRYHQYLGLLPGGLEPVQQLVQLVRRREGVCLRRPRHLEGILADVHECRQLCIRGGSEEVDPGLEVQLLAECFELRPSKSVLGRSGEPGHVQVPAQGVGFDVLSCRYVRRAEMHAVLFAEAEDLAIKGLIAWLLQYHLLMAALVVMLSVSTLTC